MLSSRRRRASCHDPPLVREDAERGARPRVRAAPHFPKECFHGPTARPRCCRSLLVLRRRARGREGLHQRGGRRRRRRPLCRQGPRLRGRRRRLHRRPPPRQEARPGPRPSSLREKPPLCPALDDPQPRSQDREDGIATRFGRVDCADAGSPRGTKLAYAYKNEAVDLPLRTLRRMADFSGRSRRTEAVYYGIASYALSLVLGFATSLLSPFDSAYSAEALQLTLAIPM